MQGTDQVLVNIKTGHRCQRFLCLWFMSSCHSASSPFICHGGTSLKAELHQRACKRCRRLSDVSVSPVCILLQDFQCHRCKKKKKKWFLIFGQWAHLPEPPAEWLETDLGIVIKLLKNCFFDIFHVMWPSDSNPAAHCISKVYEWDTAIIIVF